MWKYPYLLLLLPWPIEAAVAIELIAGLFAGSPVEALIVASTVIGLVHRPGLVYAALPNQPPVTAGGRALHNVDVPRLPQRRVLVPLLRLRNVGARRGWRRTGRRDGCKIHQVQVLDLFLKTSIPNQTLKENQYDLLKSVLTKLGF